MRPLPHATRNVGPGRPLQRARRAHRVKRHRYAAAAPALTGCPLTRLRGAGLLALTFRDPGARNSTTTPLPVGHDPSTRGGRWPARHSQSRHASSTWDSRSPSSEPSTAGHRRRRLRHTLRNGARRADVRDGRGTRTARPATRRRDRPARATGIAHRRMRGGARPFLIGCPACHVQARKAILGSSR
jgi:hypothetical protein